MRCSFMNIYMLCSVKWLYATKANRTTHTTNMYIGVLDREICLLSVATLMSSTAFKYSSGSLLGNYL